jgi:hypothetical protein
LGFAITRYGNGSPDRFHDPEPSRLRKLTGALDARVL